MLTYSVTPWPEFAVEAQRQGLWEAHWKEIAQDQDIPLVPEYATYQALYLGGRLHVVTGRDAHGTLCAYWVGLVQPHLHYATTIHALCDVYWLAPAHRKGFEGSRLFKAVEATLRERGVQKIITATKVYLDVSPIFERLGYRLTEKVYTKRLEA